MLFNRYVFLFVFLPIVYLVFWMLPRATVVPSENYIRAYL